MSSTDESSSECVSCTYCRESIKKGACKCYKCGNYQRVSRNWIGILGIAVAVITFMVSTTLSVVEAINDYRGRISWRDNLEVVTFNTNGSVTVLNSRNTPLYLQSLSVVATPVVGPSGTALQVRDSQAIPLDVTVRGDSFHSVSFRAGAGPYMNQRTLNRCEGDDSCQYVFFSSDHPFLEILTERQAVTTRATCKIRFRSITPSWHDQDFPCVGALQEVSTEQGR